MKWSHIPISDLFSISVSNSLLGILGLLDKASDLALAGLFSIGVQVVLKVIERRFFPKK